MQYLHRSRLICSDLSTGYDVSCNVSDTAYRKPYRFARHTAFVVSTLSIVQQDLVLHPRRSMHIDRNFPLIITVFAILGLSWTRPPLISIDYSICRPCFPARSRLEISRSPMLRCDRRYGSDNLEQSFPFRGNTNRKSPRFTSSLAPRARNVGQHFIQPSRASPPDVPSWCLYRLTPQGSCSTDARVQPSRQCRVPRFDGAVSFA